MMFSFFAFTTCFLNLRKGVLGSKDRMSFLEKRAMFNSREFYKEDNAKILDSYENTLVKIKEIANLNSGSITSSLFIA